MTIETWNDIIKYGAYSQELPWFAVDNQENVGAFVATMNAPIPDKVKSSFQTYIQIRQAIDLLPKITTALLVTLNEGNFSDWICYAEKGLYAFDFQDIHRQEKTNYYDLIAKPILPLKLESINSREFFFINMVKLDCDFAKGDVSEKFIM